MAKSKTLDMDEMTAVVLGRLKIGLLDPDITVDSYFCKGRDDDKHHYLRIADGYGMRTFFIPIANDLHVKGVYLKPDASPSDLEKLLKKQVSDMVKYFFSNQVKDS